MTGDRQTTVTYDPAELLRRHDPASKLELYFQLLLQENEKINLVSRETGKAGFAELKKLAAQSLLPLEKIVVGEIDNYLDIGSGGGFPAVPILLTRKVRRACLVERTRKKAAALRRILMALDVRAEIVNRSFEETFFKPEFDLITLRLVKLTPQLLERIHAVLSPKGFLVCYTVPGFDLAAGPLRVRTFNYSTSTGKSAGSFTLFHKTA